MAEESLKHVDPDGPFTPLEMHARQVARKDPEEEERASDPEILKEVFHISDRRRVYPWDLCLIQLELGFEFGLGTQGRLSPRISV